MIANVPFAKWADGKWDINPQRGVITSQGCACEDYDRAIAAGQTSKARRVKLHVAPLNPAAGRPEEKLQMIRDGKVWQYFYIYGETGTLQDQVADVDAEQAIPAFVLADLPRVARLARWQWNALLIHLTVNRWGRPPEQIFGEERAQELRGEQ